MGTGEESRAKLVQCSTAGEIARMTGDGGDGEGDREGSERVERDEGALEEEGFYENCTMIGGSADTFTKRPLQFYQTIAALLLI